MLNIEGIVEDLKILQTNLNKEVIGEYSSRKDELNNNLEGVLNSLNSYIVNEIDEDEFKEILANNNLTNISEILNDLDYDVECDELYQIE